MSMPVIREAALAAFFGAFFGAFFEAFFSKLTEFLNVVTEKQVREELHNLENIVLSIQAELDAAEEKHVKDEPVKSWLADLQNLAYEADDVLDEYATEALRRKLTRERQDSSGKLRKLLHTCFSHYFSSNSAMMNKIKEITTRFQELAERKSALPLTENVGGRPNTAIERPETTSLVTETQVYGRAKDKEAIFELISNRNVAEICVIPIVGMGGIGKTTLAKLVYNDNRVNNYFNLKAWVFVSETFDITDITKSILLSVAPESCKAQDDLNKLQTKLKATLFGKKLLLILDDLWHQIDDDWVDLLAPFGEGTTIIVTTRERSVSSMTRTIPADCKLQRLSDKDCLSVLTRHALGAKDFSRHMNLKDIGEKIVEKCKGLPLAARTIGVLLRNKVNLDAWEDILESKFWDLPEKRSNVIPALRISYHHLPPCLRRCFAYCAILPKDYEFTETGIVWLWMAEGFLREGAVKKNENLGQEIFQELVSRSLFEISNQDKSRYVMHDLINDLAQSVAKEICFRVEGDKELNISNHGRHSSYIAGPRDGVKKFLAFDGRERLRTLLALKMPNKGYCYISNHVLNDLLSKLKYLRVLSLEGYYLTKLPNVFGDLMHLRYLNFSYTLIESLPDSICQLYNLETLILQECSYLKEFPSKMRFLINLRHLDITGASSLKRMPMGIGELTNLQTLTTFIVSQDNDIQIREMKNLSNLKGRLVLSGLKHIVKAQESLAAQLYDKSNICDLTLQWDSDCFVGVEENQIHKDVLNSLRPHSGLERLAIKCYGGETFPNWIGDPSFEKLSHLELHNCHYCTSLPAIGKLPLLTSLSLKQMRKVTIVGANFFGENVSIAFPKLEELFFESMPKWKEWDPCEVDEHVKNFQHLRRLSISYCDELLGSLPTRLPSLEELEIGYCGKLRGLPTCPPSLKKLVIRGCKQLVVSLPSLPMLCDLRIDGCQEVMATSSTNFGSFMKSVSLSNISKFTCPMDMMLALRKAESLSVVSCEELISSWLNQGGSSAHSWPLRFLEIQNCSQLASIGVEDEKEEQMQLVIPHNIEDLSIKYCERLERLSESLHSYTSLTVLLIEGCPRLISFSMRNLPANLRSLTIFNCENLQYLLDERENVHINSTFLLEILDIGCCKSFISLFARGELPLQVRLQHVRIWGCEKLASLSSNGKLPIGLTHLDISKCRSLESIAHEIPDNSSLKKMSIDSCKNFRSLPRGLDKLNDLEEIRIVDCPNLISFPGNGLLTPKLRKLHLNGCEKLEALPNCMHNIVSLEKFLIHKCPSVVSFPEEGFPTNLISLTIWQPNICNSVIKWGLHKLTSLKHFSINGAFLDVVSFPHEEMLLPPSLTSLTIIDFPNLEILSSEGFQHLTSLEVLQILFCPKLRVLPRKEMFPSLLELRITSCLLLELRCQRDEGQEWPKIAHVPFIKMHNIHRWEVHPEIR